MKKLAITFCLLSTTCFAQQPVEFNIKLKATDVDIVGKALGKLPYEDVALLIQNLRQQIIEQQSVKPAAEEKK